MSLSLTGVHHVSALSAHIGRSHNFHTRVLGLRPLIKTVNQDEPSMYHLFYGDGAGSPGSDLTIFDLPHAARERRGNNSISLTTFRVQSEGVLDYWLARFEEQGVVHSEITTRDRRPVLDFDDSEGIQLSLVVDEEAAESDAYPWDESPVPAEFQSRGLGYTVITVPTLGPTDRFLTEGLGLQPKHTYPLAGAPQYEVHVYNIGDGGAHAEVHVIVRDDLPRAQYGAGGVHHVALRIPEEQRPRLGNWVEHLNGLGYRNSGIVDRYYFTSIYVREPNHILFELATDGPGFDVDGPLDGERLQLPPFLEPRRAEIEAQLKPLVA